MTEVKEEKDAALAATQNKEKQPTGRVVGILKRAWRPFVILLFLCNPSAAQFNHHTDSYAT